MKSHPSIETSVETIKTFFAHSTNPQRATVREIYLAADRKDLNNTERNKAWLRNRLLPLKHYGLVVPIHSKKGALLEIQLTQKGKDLLEITHSPRLSSPATVNKETLLGSIAQSIKEFQKQNPSLLVEFRVTLKEEDEQAT